MDTLISFLATAAYTRLAYWFLAPRVGETTAFWMMLIYVPLTLLSTVAGLDELSWDDTWYVKLAKGLLLYPWGGTLVLGGGLLAIVAVSRLFSAILTPIFIFVVLLVIVL
jgi:hypothetical protein